jgi:tellurite resistance protein
VSCERVYGAQVLEHPLASNLLSQILPSDSKEVRRRLMARSLRLTESMAPDAHRLAHEAQQVLCITGNLEIYQRSGAENAAMHMVPEPILLEIHGSLLTRLDAASLLGLFGHELGHYLAHGQGAPTNRAVSLTCVLGQIELDRTLEKALSKLSMAAELTADRVGLLACQDLHAMLRLEMATVTGLSSEGLTWDTDAYLAQCRDLIEEGLAQGAAIMGGTHPEHSLRAYALWLFSETRTYRDLTGQGPGSRELAEVDATLSRCFEVEGPNGPELDYSRTGEPSPELFECALAASVIVALADGEAAEDELAAIERIFASLIPDWRTYLSFDIALERFLDVAPIVAGMGSDQVRNVFTVLLHVVLADGVVDARELDMVLSIGRALGAEAPFRRWLLSALKALRVEVPVETSAAQDLPLPAKRGDVQNAFGALLKGIVRRGEGTITLRRILRILGADRRNEQLVGQIARGFVEHGIETTADLDSVPLDDALHLVAPLAQRPKPEPTAPLPASRAALLAALKRLREQLVSGDGRSPSIRLRQPRRGRTFDLMALDRISVGSGERLLAQLMAGRGTRIVDAGDAGRHSSAASVSTDLLALLREDAQCFEETGAQDLYVGYPFLIGNVAGYSVRGPLVLYPVQLERDGDGARGFRLSPRSDEPAVANQSLLRLIFNKRGFAYSDELSDELENIAGLPDGGPEGLRRRLTEVGLDTTQPGSTLQAFRERDTELLERGEFLEIEEVEVLGLFPQSSSDLLQDYDGLLQDLSRPGVDVSTLLNSAAALLPDSMVEKRPSAAESTTIAADWAPVIAADPSQRSVITECRRHGATVVDGPPGTGKSQVICNLVAEALRRGERVAVVCEKRAALDVVYQRMTAIGFAKALAVVHDVYEDRKALYEHIANRIEQKERIPFDAGAATRVGSEYGQLRQQLEARAAVLRLRPPGLDMSIADLLTFIGNTPAPRITVPDGLTTLSQPDLRQLLDITVAMHPLIDVWGAASSWRSPRGVAPRPLLAGATPSSLRELQGHIEGAIAAARRYESLESVTPVPVDTVDAARGAIAIAVESRSVRRDVDDQEMFGALVPLATRSPDRLEVSDQARATWSENHQAMTLIEHPVELEPAPELVAALSVLTRWTQTWLRFFVLAWWKARSVLRRELGRVWPERAGDALTPKLLDDVKHRIEASRGWRSLTQVFEQLGVRHLLPGTATKVGQIVERVSLLGPPLRRLGQSHAQLSAAAAWLPTEGPIGERMSRWDQSLDERQSVLAARDTLRAAAAPVVAAFPWLPALPRTDALEPLLRSWREDSMRLAEADSLLERALKLVPGALQLFDGLVEQGANAASDWRSNVGQCWARGWLSRLEKEQRGLAQLGLGADDRDTLQQGRRLEVLETERRELEIERTLAQIDDAEILRVEAAEKHQRRTPAQKVREDLLKEARKRRMLLPLRTFVRRFAPAGLLGVVPVWLLSPETMAILFPREALFDLVIFDEASQCTVEAGLPVLLRAKRVVIAGDEKQMPPSSYFAMGSAGDDEDTDAASTEDAKQEVRDLLGAESLLSLARPRVSRAGLEWHYRCREESLIAFSNHSMYEGGLLTIPSTSGTAGPGAITWVAVPNGVYQAGENLIEAARVVDVVDELLKRQPRPTIGVVTFNLKQRKAVLDAIDTRAGQDQTFRDRWNEASGHQSLDERPFVKNLEQVQGDERDVIVFSLGHAPQERRRKGSTNGERYVAARFGPLGQRGGERRLNVAISRAKSACYVVASFEPSQLTVAASRHDGPRLFKHFLEFAHHLHHGHRIEAARVLDLVRARQVTSSPTRARTPIDGFVPLKAQISLALEEAGIPHEVDVGSSGFQVPIAIVHPEDPARFVLCLLFDDAQTKPDAFDFHVHRPGVLRQRGWKVLAVSVASWHRRASAIIDEIAELVPGARGATTSEAFRQRRAELNQVRPVAPAVLPYPMPTTALSVDSAVPSWALAITDPLFRKALLHIDRHGRLAEAELTSLVGGPRRARLFASQLEEWKANLPFSVVVEGLSGSMIYRRGPASAIN